MTVYAWDHRNRLVSVTEYASTTDADAETNATQIVEQTYDAYNQWIGRDLDADGDGDVDSATTFVHDDGQIVLQFEDADGEGVVEDDELTHRYLWGPAVDEILAAENVDDLLLAGDVLWPLTGNLGSVRDIAEYDSGTDTTTVTNHITYDSFGKVETESNSGIDILFGYTGRAFDEYTELQNNLNRWYEATTHLWVSQDPISFTAGDANLYRYVKNFPLSLTDPDGLEPKVVAAVGRALAAGDVKLALTLIRDGLSARAGATTISAILTKIYDKFPAASQRCDQALRLTQEVFRAAGRDPVKLKIIGSRGETFFSVNGQRFSSNGQHFATLSNGRVYDALTGPGGMPLKEYIQFWAQSVGTNPIITDPAGKVIK